MYLEQRHIRRLKYIQGAEYRAAPTDGVLTFPFRAATISRDPRSWSWQLETWVQTAPSFVENLHRSHGLSHDEAECLALNWIEGTEVMLDVEVKEG